MTAADNLCFVIMPFGVKKDDEGNDIDFDLIYDDLYVEPAKAAGLTIVRCDKIARAGSIHEDMFTHIAMDDVVIVDVTTANPNVFYELGVRHALAPSVTVLTRRRGTKSPFNIQGQRIIEYPGADGSWATSRREIEEFIRNGQQTRHTDSPIFTILQDARKDWRRERIEKLEKHSYQIRQRPDVRIAVITGDIRQWPGIDVWVNSENTNMQMARFFDRSLSAMIRYEGATKDENGEIVADTVATELADVVGNRETVTPGNVYVTSAGDLANGRGVKKIFHAATTQGVPGSGYQVIQEVEKCVNAVLRRMDVPQYRDELRSVVFPMMGTGEGGGDVTVVAGKLIRTAIGYFQANPASTVQTVYFSAWNRRDLDACLKALDLSGAVEAVAD